MPDPAPSHVFVAPEGERLALAGPPGRLTGRVELRNSGEVAVVLRDVSVRDPSGVLPVRPRRQALAPIVLRPAQARTVSLRIAVDPTTPPGEYRVELDLSGRSRPAVLHVVEAFELTLRPSSIVVANRPDEAQQKRVIVANTGNVPFTVAGIGDVDLRDDMVWDRTLRVAIEPLADRERIAVEELAEAVLRAREAAYRVASLSVRVLAGAVDVGPGETAVIDLEITLREALPPGSRYRGRAAVLTRDLEIIVVSSGELGEGRPTTTRPRRAGTRARRADTAPRTTPKRRGGGH